VPPGVELEPPPGGLDLTGNGGGNGETPLHSGGAPEAAKPRAS
jgi:hypothetical protein